MGCEGGNGKNTQLQINSPIRAQAQPLGPASAFQLDHTPTMTIPSRKCALMRTDRSSFWKGGEKKPQTRQSRHPQ